MGVTRGKVRGIFQSLLSILGNFQKTSTGRRVEGEKDQLQDIPATTAASEQQFSIEKKKSSWGKSKTLIFGAGNPRGDRRDGPE